MCIHLTKRDRAGALASSKESSSRRIKDDRDKKPKPIREESFPAELVFQRNDFTYIDRIVDPDRASRRGPKGYPPSAMFMALLLMYLKGMKSVLALVRFLTGHQEWLRIFGLKRRVDGVEVYSVPDRTRFYRLASRMARERIIEVFARMVVEMMWAGIIKGRSISLDATIIWAWFKDLSLQEG